MTEIYLLNKQIVEQRDKIISQGAQIQRMYTTIRLGESEVNILIERLRYQDEYMERLNGVRQMTDKLDVEAHK